MLNYYQSPLVVLLETHIQDHHSIKEDFAFSHLSQAYVECQARGIVVLWNDQVVQITEIVVTEQEIHCMIQVCPHGTPFLFTAIYASNVLSSRKILWQNLKHIAGTYKGSWLVGVTLMIFYTRMKNLEDVC